MATKKGVIDEDGVVFQLVFCRLCGRKGTQGKLLCARSKQPIARKRYVGFLEEDATRSGRAGNVFVEEKNNENRCFLWKKKHFVRKKLGKGEQKFPKKQFFEKTRSFFTPR